MKSPKTTIQFPYPDLKQGCPDWKASLLTTTLTVLAGRDNYNIHTGKRALFRLVIRRLSLSYYRFLQVNVISKREKALGYIGGQVNSLTGFPSLICFA